ncbi:MAG: PAS domain S-box protein [Bacteroidota bacterium]
MKIITILLIEDNLSDVRLVSEMLKESNLYNYNLFTSGTLKDGCEQIHKNNFDVILLDLNLPDSTGQQTFKKVMDCCGSIPVILVSGLKDEELSLKFIKEGAQDYITKQSLIPDLLGKAIQYSIERRHTEEILRESERKLKEAQSIGKIGNWEFDIFTQNITWSDQVFKLYERDINLGNPTVEEEAKYYTEKQAEALRNFTRQSIDSNLEFNNEIEPILPSGRKVYYSSTIRPVKDENGKVIKLFGTVQDITERKLSEETLSRSHEKYQAIFESTGTATLIVEEDRTIIMANNECLQLTGYTPSELIGQKWTQYVAPESLQEMIKNHNLRRQDPAAAPKKYEVKLVNRKGDIRVSFLDINMIPETQQSVVSILDITERKQAEEELRESEELFAKIFRASPIAVSIARVSNGKLTEINDVWSKLMGFSREEAVGYNVEELKIIDTEARNKLREELVSKGYLRLVENEITTKSGEKKSILTSSELIALKGNQFSVNSVIDITERKQSERWQHLLSEILSILNVPTAFDETISSILTAIKRETGFDAVGVRLRSGDDFPYFDQKGFSDDFLLTENTLTIRNESGLCRDENGKPCLECTCGVVLSGKTDPSRPLFTEGGSAWTNDSLPILDIPAAEDIRLHPRNRCIHEGFHSVALIPIRSDNEIVGLLQLNDHKKNCFTLDMIHFYERISESIGVALKRRQAEKDLMESEKKFRSIFENIQDVYYEATLDGIILEVSPSVVNISLYKRKELIGRNILGLYSDFSDRQKFFEEMTKNGFVIDFEISLLDKNGSVQRCSVTSKFLYDKENKPCRIVGSMRNIEARKKAEEEMNKAFEKYKELFDTSNDIIYTMDFKGNFTSVSPSAERLLGYKLEALSNRNMTNFISEETAGIAFENITKKLKGEKTNTVYEVEFKNNFGSVTDLEMNSMIRYKNGQPIEVFGIARDITEKKKLSNELKNTLDNLEKQVTVRTEELSRSEELYYTTVNSISDWIYVIDRNYRIVFANDSLKKIFTRGGDGRELLGMYMKDVFTFLDTEDYGNIEQVFSEGIQVINESEYDVFGKKYYTQRKISPVFLNNEVIRVVVTVIDITKHKEIENEIMKNLEKEKGLNVMKAQFISTVSHEFRTPLAGILSSVQLLMRYDNKWTDEKKEKMFKQIIDAVNHTKTLLNDVSIIDKDHSDKIPLKPAMIDLKEFLDALIDENIQIFGPGFGFTTRYDLPAVNYNLDRDIIRHIIGNIISNAIKYSGNSRKIIFSASESNNQIVFEVTDYGIGIPSEELKHLYEPFYRASNVENIKGTGFGLSIVKRFVDQCSGEIKIVSEKDKGTCVTVILPILKILNNKKKSE